MLRNRVAAALEHAAQGAAWAHGFGGRSEFAEKKQHPVLEGMSRQTVRQQSHRRIREPRVPAGELDVVVELVVGIPTKDHVAKAKALVQCAKELFLRHVFAAQDAIDVEDADLDVAEATVLDDGLGVLSASNLGCFHHVLRVLAG